MSLTPQIIFRDIPKSVSLETQIRNKISKLTLFCDEIMHCDIELSQTQKNANNGKLYQSRISISVPGKEIVVNHKLNEDAYVCIRDAFNAARRQLQDYMRKKRGQVKTHELLISGYITSLLADDQVGFITAAGNEYYFTKDNVSAPTFAELSEGMLVSFMPAVDKVGHRAHRVHLTKSEERAAKH